MKTAATLFISLLMLVWSPLMSFGQTPHPRATFRFEELDLRASLDSLMRWFPVSIVYLDKDVEGKQVTASCTDCSIDRSLDAVLQGTSLTWTRIGNQVVLGQRQVSLPREPASISGSVSDSATGERVAGATVFLQDSVGQPTVSVRRWCPTNPYGFFSLRDVPRGAHTLVVHALGYRAAEIPVVVDSGANIQYDFRLREQGITLQEVTVEGRRTALASVDGISRGIYIRSAPTDQNQYLLDGARIYNPSHFGGVFSTFNEEILNDVQVAVGGLPPYYGGRVGGIVDLSMRDGTMERLSGAAGTGSLGSHIYLEGPVNGATTFLMSVRRGYPDPAVPFLNEKGTPSRLGSSEIIAKISHRPSGGSQFSLSGYYGDDRYDNLVQSNAEQLSNNFAWGNRALSLRWVGVAPPSLFIYATAIYTRYDLGLDQVLTGTASHAPGLRASSSYTVEDVALRAHADDYYDGAQTFRAGVELIRHRIRGSIDELAMQTAPMSLNGAASWEATVYLQDEWRVMPRVTAEIGGRATTFITGSGAFSGVDPRFSLLMLVSERTRAYCSLTAINEYIHPYRNSGLFLLYPGIFWYPSSDRIHPSNSLQFTLGAESATEDDGIVLSAESYYRTTNNLQEFIRDTLPVALRNFDNTILSGTGRVYGLVCSVRKRTGDFTASLYYNLSLAQEQFPGLNNGEPFAPPFDRRHEVQLACSYAPDQRWAFGILCLIASGQVSSVPTVAPGDRAIPLSGPPTLSNASLPEFFDINGGRFPGFQRLELNASHRFVLSDLSCQLSLRLLNGYGLLDPFVWQLHGGGDLRSIWSAAIKDLKLFPLYPTISLDVKF